MFSIRSTLSRSWSTNITVRLVFCLFVGVGVDLRLFTIMNLGHTCFKVRTEYLSTSTNKSQINLFVNKYKGFGFDLIF